jgi:hypothetical protein
MMANASFLERILSAWREAPDRPLSISQVAAHAESYRQAVGGALAVLQELGFVELASASRTYKAYRLHPKYTFDSVIQAVRAYAPSSPIAPAAPPSHTKESWQAAMEPLLAALCMPQRIDWYITDLSRMGPEKFHFHLINEAQHLKGDSELSDAERAVLADDLSQVLQYGLDHFGLDFVVASLQAYLDARGYMRGEASH